jgi:hypothetical protein
LRFSPLIGELWDIIQACLQEKPAERPKTDDLVAMRSKLCSSNEKQVEGDIV